jgi:asparagine synthase (glutamine-hydrolysing)
MPRPVAEIVDLIDPASQDLGGASPSEAACRLFADDPKELFELGGSFALVARRGVEVRLARSLDRPLRYFLAKQADGPLLVVADRIDAIAGWLAAHGFGDQFQPSYTRMVPAHTVTTLRLLGCPDPNPSYQRFLVPAAEPLAPDLDAIGDAYVGALLAEVHRWLDRQDPRAPIGVLFSGGIDSGSVLLAFTHALLARGESPARLKAFTLRIGGGGADAEQAHEFLRAADLEVLWETVDVPASALDPEAAVAAIEDYKARDVECATVALALLAGIRERYPDWLLLADGDGGDENLKDYPIEENPELTLRSVVGNPLLYQEGWGHDSLKHSLTYSGGYSRACVRTWAPLTRFGFRGFSPYTRPAVVAVATAIPFGELAQGSHERLYALKGEIVRRGLEHLTGLTLPLFPKRRFQEGATPEALFARLFAGGEPRWRQAFFRLYAARPAA